ncbi:DUF4142 domain-containing protein [Mesorhizobium sp. BR1-1-14]|nr:DUF4142 domain-containing protein [Mesorhizobium sp. BR1-1-14]
MAPGVADAIPATACGSSDPFGIPHGTPLSVASLRRCHCRQKLTGVEFDLAYISGQIVDHQKTVQLLEGEIGSGQDPDVQHFASDIHCGSALACRAAWCRERVKAILKVTIEDDHFLEGLHHIPLWMATNLSATA